MSFIILLGFSGLLFFVLTAFSALSLGGTPSLDAFEDREQMLALSRASQDPVLSAS